jgi:hypothetical protein
VSVEARPVVHKWRLGLLQYIIQVSVEARPFVVHNTSGG